MIPPRGGRQVLMADSMLDGTPTLRLSEFVMGSIDKGVIPMELPDGEKNTSPMPKPEEIVFELDKHLEGVIAKSQKGFEEEMSLQDLKAGPLTVLSARRLMIDGQLYWLWQEHD